MDYSFGFEKEALDKYGAKPVVFDKIREIDPEIRIHPYLKVPIDMDALIARYEAGMLSRAASYAYYIVRGSSRYELLPGTAGMTSSKRFVPLASMEEVIEEVRTPTRAYSRFVDFYGLEPEKKLPAVIQPMVAESYGAVTEHPNQDLMLVDYHQGDDSERIFQNFGYFFHDEAIKTLTRFKELFSSFIQAGEDKYYARYSKQKGLLEENLRDSDSKTPQSAEKLFERLGLMEGPFDRSYTWQMEYGPDPSTKEPILYQYRPFCKKQEPNFSLKKTDADLVFGICEEMELPVARLDSALYISRAKSPGLEKDPELDNALFAVEYGEQMGDRELHLAGIERYQGIMSRRIKELYGDNFCLAMQKYQINDRVDFTSLRPRAVVIMDDFRAGMVHNRTNLIQSVPAVIFGNSLCLSDCENVRIACDGTNALVERL